MMKENHSICVIVQVQTAATSWRTKITARASRGRWSWRGWKDRTASERCLSDRPGRIFRRDRARDKRSGS